MSANRSTRVQTIAMSAACLIVLLIVGAFLFDAIRDESVTESLPTLLGYATPAMITLLTAAKLGGAVDEVKTQVNGNYDKVTTRNRELADQNRELLARIAALTGDPDSGAIPVQSADDAGRHRRGPLDGVTRAQFSAGLVEGVHTAGGDVAHAANTRTVSGLVLPWEKIGQTTAGAIAIRRNGVRIPRDLSRCKLHSDHTGTPNHRPVGYAVAAEYKADGLHMTFQVAATPDGDAALTDVTEHVRDAFSAELAGIRKDGNAVFDSILTGVALVDTPAFRDARVQDVHAAFHNPTTPNEGNTMNPKDFILALMRAGQTEADARAAAVVQFGQAAVDAVSADDLDFTDAEDQGDAADGAPADGAPATAAASYTPRVVIPGAASRRESEPVHLSMHQAAETIRAIYAGEDVAHAALTDIKASGMVDATVPQWLGELWSGPAKNRRLIPLLTQAPLRSRRIQGFTWTQKPMVAEYAGDKAEIPTGPVAIAPHEAAAVRWAGGHDLDRAFFDFGETDILEAYWRAMAESYAIVTDTAAGVWVVANAKVITDAAATDLTRAMIAASGAVEDKTGVNPSYYIANPADKYTLLSTTAANMPAYLDIFGVTPRSIVWSSAVPAGTLVAGAKPAATFYELPGSPLRVEAEHLSHGGRDRAMFGYTALMLDNPDGLVKIQFAGGGA